MLPWFRQRLYLSTRHQRFAFAHLLDTHLTRSARAFSPLAHHHAFWTQQQGVV